MKLRELFSLFSKKMTLRPAIEEKNDTQRIEEIFQELRDISHKRQRLEKYVRRIEKQKQDLEQYEGLTEEDHIKVTKLLGQYKNVIEQRRLMEGRLIRNNPALRILENYETEVPELIEEIRKTENNQRHSHQDMLYLENEKNYLYDYRESLVTGYKALKFIAIGLVLILGIVCMVLLTMVQALRQNIFIPSSIISIITLFFIFGILIFKRRIEYELEKNEILQKKVVKLLNTVKIRYFHHTNYLNFQYNKLGIINADQLKSHYDRYMKNKNNEVHYKNMNNQLVEIENKVFDILYDTGIERNVFNQIDEWAEIQNVDKLLKNLRAEDKNTTKQLGTLEAYEQELSKEVLIITQTRPELASIVESLMKNINT